MSEIEDQLIPKYIENQKITNGNYDKSLAVKCVNGTFVGKKKDNVIAYKGIPFVGQQPVGPLRWKAPVGVTPNDGIYEAYYYGKSPFQAEGDPCSLYVMGEDCLYLNVWKAAEASAEKKPVMVWIYGGGFETGGTVDPQYDCYNFITENPDVIIVTVAYRLAAYGFMRLSHLPDGADYPDAQNLGIMDQLMGLKWVHENIAAFGGDPDNVTIWGESAGGSSCTLLALVKGSQKYFKRVITQSGTPVMTRSTEDSIAWTNEVMKELNCKTVADLQKVSPEELTATVGRMFGIYQVLGFRIWPERDGKLIPTDPWEAYANGAAKNIDYLLGCNKDEINVFAGALGVEGWNAWAAGRMEKKAKVLTAEEYALLESYLKHAPGEDWEKTTSLISQNYFNAPAIRLSENQTKAGGKVFTYLFTPEASVPMVKSGHAIEQSAVFGHPDLVDLSGRAFDATFTKTMRKLWIQFAKTGNPSLSAAASPDGKAKEWPLYDLKDKKVMVLDEFDIHPAKESDVKIVDWDRTYFLTKYYMS
jgi:para-nitrobenzyl esterase